MESREYAIILEAFKDLPPKERVPAYWDLPEVSEGGALSDWERSIAESKHPGGPGSRPWMAVGEAGLKVGSVILPPDGETSLSISDVPYIIESALEASEPPGAACAYVVEPQGPITIDPAAFRMSLLCALDPTLDDDMPEVFAAVTEAACCRLCGSAKVLVVLTLPPETGAKH